MPLEQTPLERQDLTGGPDALLLGRQRSRRAMLSGVSAMLARSVQGGILLLTIPLTLKYLGTERFGLWMTMSSVLAMATFADFGIGNGVLNTVAKAFGQDDIPAIRRVVSSGFATLTVIAGALFALFLCIYPFVPWGRVFRVTSPLAIAEAGPALIIFVLCFALNISLDVVQRTQFGIQQGYRFGLWQMSGTLVGFAGVLVAIRLHGGLPVLILAIAGGPVSLTLANAVQFFGFSRRDLRPSPRLVSREAIRQIASLGLMFFVLQVVVAAASSADNFIIARSLGAVHVPEYAIPQRMFALIGMLSAMLVTPLWAAYGEAVSRGDLVWIRNTLKRSLLAVFVASVSAASILFLLARPLLLLWVGSRIHPSTVLLLGLAIWSVMDCCGNALSMFLNGASIMKFQVVTSSLFGLSCVLTKILLIPRFGVQAVPWSTVISYTLFSILPCVVLAPRAVRGLSRAAGRPAPIQQESV